MGVAARRVAGPLWLDDDHAFKVHPKTLARYRKDAQPLANYLQREGMCPAGEEEWDDAVVEYSISGNLSKSVHQ